MRAALLKLQGVAGIDRAVSATVLMRLISAFAGLVTLAMVGTRLSKAEQGFYYTFNNLLQLQVFFELGMSFVILQTASHERARLDWSFAGALEGDPVSKARLASLLRLSIKWYVAIAGLMLTCVLPAGIAFLAHAPGTADVGWQAPWIALVVVTALYVVLNALFAFLEGCGLVSQIATARLVQTIAGSLALWSVLIANRGLFAAAANIGLFVLAGTLWLALKHRVAIIDLLRTPNGESRVDWRGEIWPFQWRIAVSWLCGFFISQLFTPVLFHYQGPAEAGRMGMVLAVTGPISGMAMAWITTKSPRFGNLIALGEFDELDRLYDASLRRMLAVVVTGAFALTVGVYLLQSTGSAFGERLLPYPATAAMATAMVLNSLVFAQAAYLRAHKREPFLGLSLLVAVLVAVCTFALGPRYGAIGVTTGYLVVSGAGLVIATAIFRKRRAEWRAEATA